MGYISKNKIVLMLLDSALGNSLKGLKTLIWLGRSWLINPLSNQAKQADGHRIECRDDCASLL